MSEIIGIDLGTTFSALAKLNSIGKPEIIPNAEGERLTPSAIYFDDEDTDVIRVGIEAINSRHVNAERSVRWIKRHIGDKEYKKVIDSRQWTALELSSLILRKLKQECCADRNSKPGVVISVPAHFNELQRKDTMNAGELAGLDVIGIVNEPVAAALFYATDCAVSGKVLVYDLGGGTFDVTVMDVKDSKIDIICSQGDHALGGIDFDNAILKIMEGLYKAEHGTELIDSDEQRALLEDEAEDIKKTLSRRKSAKKMIYGSAGSLRMEITREMFEKAIDSIVERTIILLEVALKEADLAASEIDKVLLVGGSSRIPMVQQRLEKMFGYAPEIAVNVDECVALGAALHAGLTTMRNDSKSVSAGIAKGLKGIKLTDVCNHSYGTLCAPVDKLTGKRVVENRIILKKNTPLPCEQVQTFYTTFDGQDMLQVSVTQGEDADPEYVNTIAVQKLELPSGRDKDCPIKVAYSYDLNQRMHCRFEDVRSGKIVEVNLDMENDTETEQSNSESNEQVELYQVE